MGSTRYKLQRYKFQKYQTGIIDINLWKYEEDSAEQFCQKKVEVIGNICDNVEGYKYIKYLASDGKYKFIPFVRSVTLQQNDTSIGEVSTLITSLKGSNVGKASIGFSTNKQMVLSTPVDKNQYLTYVEVLSSPRVYLQKDTDELRDEDENWLLVTVDGGNTYNIRKPKDIFTITITLPDYNNIRM